MKLIFLSIFLSVALIYQADCDDDQICNTDLQCDIDECCRWNTFKTSKICKDKRDDLGERCGGDYTCDCDITKQLMCIKDTSILSYVQRGTGTCQRIVGTVGVGGFYP